MAPFLWPTLYMLPNDDTNGTWDSYGENFVPTYPDTLNMQDRTMKDRENGLENDRHDAVEHWLFASSDINNVIICIKST